uniref:GTP-binding protein LepA n=1 Tax=Kwoniella pini CBS 10737 TaxID=1296096 RepID=A0A1B9HYB9_9TREE|nr:GTP-binding protein LepA [Kwoniella pini CBS 10737]OCF48260.1 GTP-binding protein LepA [Kwoniella pini CBS 10737]
MSSLGRSSRPCAACLRRIRSSKSPSSPIRMTASSSYASSSRIGQTPETSAIPSGIYHSVRHVSTSSHWLAKATDITSKKRIISMGEFPPERIRNLSIIAHIDHGKSTLADRLLQMTGTVPSSSNPQFLDKLKVERERGITVKAQTVSIIHEHTDGQKYLINLIDTPGHVDFSYEVSRSLGACEGGLLLVDCSQGIQAQTLSVFHHAVEANLKLLPVINKVDLPHASPEETSEEVETSLGLPTKDHMRISAKSGLGVQSVLDNIVEGLPPPRSWVEDDGKLRGLIFDTFYDQFRGVVSLVRIFSGTLKKGDKVRFLQAGKKYEILEVGINNPEEVVVDELRDGQVGYIVCNMKNSEEAFIGDTICWVDKPVEPLPGFKPMKAMVYAGVFPMDSSDFPKLEESIERLTLNDRSVSIQRESSAALSQGFRLGFLGTLHMDVFKQRLEDEYSSEVIVTAPTVPYKVIYLNGTEEYISNPVDFPEVTDSKMRVRHVEEPMTYFHAISEYLGEMMDLCSRYRGVQQEYRILENSDRAILRYSLPLAEIVTDFFSELKSSSSGFASFDYEEAGYQQSTLVKLNILINGKPVDALAMIVHKFAAQNVGKAWVKKLKEVVPRQQFELSLQAAVGAKVIARENVSAFRKDVTAGLYGGHYDRKLKHLNKQKEGKKRLKKLAGNIEIPQTAFFQVLSSRPRSLHTSARPPVPDSSAHTDPIIQNLPQPVPSSPSIPPQSSATPPPIGKSTVPPPERSFKLSSMGRMTSDPPPSNVTSADLHEAFRDLYRSSPDSHIFTPAEIHEILRTLQTLHNREGGDKRLIAEKFSPIIQELKDIVGDQSKAIKGLELSILSSASRRERKVKTNDILNAERLFRQVFPKQPTDEKKDVERYKAGINHLIYVCALAGHQGRFQDWWDKLMRSNLKPDSYSFLSKCILAEKTGQLDEIPQIINEAYNTGMEDDDMKVLINFNIHSFARGGRLEIALKSYAKLVDLSKEDTDSLLDSSKSLNQDYSAYKASKFEIPISSTLQGKPTKELFGPLLSVLVSNGNLIGSLIIFKGIFENEFTPTIKDYITLFKGFSIYGEIPKINKEEGLGEIGRIFGINQYDGTIIKQKLFNERDRDENFLDIWERGSSFDKNVSLSNEIKQIKIDNTNNNNLNEEWNLNTLNEIYISFLSLKPFDFSNFKNEKQKGLNKKSFWIIIKSFVRTSGGDLNLIKKIWNELELKFVNQVEDGEDGEENNNKNSNKEGWKGFKLDNRLIWAKKTLFNHD